LFFFHFPVFGTSNSKERKKPIGSSNSPRNTYARPQLKQTPSIVINSPPSSGKQAVDVADITFEEPTTQGESLGRFRATREGQTPYKEQGKISGALQHRGKDSPLPFQTNKDREPYSRLPYEKQRGHVYEYEIYSDKDDNAHRKSPNEINLAENHRDSQTREAHGVGQRSYSGARNAEPKARNVDSGARVVSPGTRSVEARTRKLSGEARSPTSRNLDQSSSDERASQKIRTSPSIFSARIDNPEGFPKPKPKYVVEDANDNSSLYKAHAENNKSVETKTNKQNPRQSQSEMNLKSKSAPDRAMYPVVKTLSDPVRIPADHSRIKPRDGNSESSLLANDALERQLNSPKDRSDLGEDRGDNVPKNKRNSPLLRRPGNNQVDTTSLNRGRTNDSFQAEKETSKEEFSAQKSRGEAKLNARAQSEVFGGLLGETNANHSAEYYDQMISKINEQINLAVSRNKSPYAVYGLGSDDDADDWC
jgi:hypothetical protein